MKNTALRDMSRDKYSTRLCLMLYLSLDTPPRALFFIKMCGGALIYTYRGIEICPIAEFPCSRVHKQDKQVRSELWLSLSMYIENNKLKPTINSIMCDYIRTE